MVEPILPLLTLAVQTPGSTLPLPGPVAPRLIPPRPPSPITSAYLRKLSSHMLIPSSQIRLLDCIGQGLVAILYSGLFSQDCANISLGTEMVVTRNIIVKMYIWRSFPRENLIPAKTRSICNYRLSLSKFCYYKL